MIKTVDALFAEAAHMAAAFHKVPLSAVESVGWVQEEAGRRPHYGCTALLSVIVRIRTRRVRFDCYLLDEPFHGSTEMVALKGRSGGGWVTYAHLQQKHANFGGLQF